MFSFFKKLFIESSGSSKILNFFELRYSFIKSLREFTRELNKFFRKSSFLSEKYFK